jgi:hypothetical protein
MVDEQREIALGVQIREFAQRPLDKNAFPDELTVFRAEKKQITVNNGPMVDEQREIALGVRIREFAQRLLDKNAFPDELTVLRAVELLTQIKFEIANIVTLGFNLRPLFEGICGNRVLRWGFTGSLGQLRGLGGLHSPRTACLGEVTTGLKDLWAENENGSALQAAIMATFAVIPNSWIQIGRRGHFFRVFDLSPGERREDKDKKNGYFPTRENCSYEIIHTTADSYKSLLRHAKEQADYLNAGSYLHIHQNKILDADESKRLFEEMFPSG